MWFSRPRIICVPFHCFRLTGRSARGREALCAEQTERERLTREFDAFAAAEAVRLGRMALPLMTATADAPALTPDGSASEKATLADGSGVEKRAPADGAGREKAALALASVPLGAALIAAAIPDLAQRIAAADEAQRRQTEAANRVWEPLLRVCGFGFLV